MNTLTLSLIIFVAYIICLFINETFKFNFLVTETWGPKEKTLWLIGALFAPVTTFLLLGFITFAFFVILIDAIRKGQY